MRQFNLIIVLITLTITEVASKTFLIPNILQLGAVAVEQIRGCVTLFIFGRLFTPQSVLKVVLKIDF